MPMTKAEFEREIKSRGGAIRYRFHTSKKGKKFKVAVVRKAGPRGGRTVAYEVTE